MGDDDDDDDDDIVDDAPPPPGPLTQGLRDLRNAVSRPPNAVDISDDDNDDGAFFDAHGTPRPGPQRASVSSPSSPLLFTGPEDNEDSFLHRSPLDDRVFLPWASDVVEVRDHAGDGADVNEVLTNPPPPAPTPPPPRLSSVVRPVSTPSSSIPPSHHRHRRFNVRRLPPPPLRDTPIQARLRSMAQPASSSSSPDDPLPVCLVCNKADGRKKTITCRLCSGHVHSHSCAKFGSHREAEQTPFTCHRCSGPLMTLPVVATPPVANRVVIFQGTNDGDESLPAAADSDSAPSSPAAAPTEFYHHPCSVYNI